jgi:oxygen-dependent protoporphyrinogen oxidase
MAGIFAGDGEKLSLAATFPQLRRIEQTHGSLIRGIQELTQGVSGPPGRSGFVAPIGGMVEMVAALEKQLDRVGIRTGTATASIRGRAQGFRVFTCSGEETMADAVILAVPAYIAAGLLSDISPHASSALGEIQYVSTATVALAYRELDLPEMPIGHGYVIPRIEGRRALACTWVSQKFAGRAPEKHALLRIFVGRAGDADPLHRTDDELLDLARSELQDTLDITARPALCRVSRWPRAMPQYTLGHLERLSRIDAELGANPGLFLAGALHGVGIPDCIQSGEMAAERAVAYLHSNQGMRAIKK